MLAGGRQSSGFTIVATIKANGRCMRRRLPAFQSRKVPEVSTKPPQPSQVTGVEQAVVALDQPHDRAELRREAPDVGTCIDLAVQTLRWR
jgi:hypothetical protein